MDIDLNSLTTKPLNIDEDITFDKTIYYNKEIVDLKNMHVSGIIRVNSIEEIEIDLKLTGEMILKDSISLEEITKDLNIKIEEEYDLNDVNFQEYWKKEQNILDIMKILWENIVLEVPISYTKTKNVSLSGDGWQFTDEEKNEECDPRLAKLKQIFDQGKE